MCWSLADTFCPCNACINSYDFYCFPKVSHEMCDNISIFKFWHHRCWLETAKSWRGHRHLKRRNKSEKHWSVCVCVCVENRKPHPPLPLYLHPFWFSNVTCADKSELVCQWTPCLSLFTLTPTVEGERLDYYESFQGGCNQIPIWLEMPSRKGCNLISLGTTDHILQLQTGSRVSSWSKLNQHAATYCAWQ